MPGKARGPPISSIDSEGNVVVKPAPLLVGQPGLKTIMTTGVKPGTCKFKMTYVRSWEWDGKFEGENNAFLVSFDVTVK